LEGSLVSSIYEVDLFKNGKIQYLFATDKKVYCLDRLGKLVENFPITLANRASINSVNVLDYENNKNYRFSITSGKNVWLYDSKGKSLDAWNPKAFSSNVIGTIDHFRIQTLDYLLVKEENGTVHLLQRNSNEYAGYPIKQLLKWNGTPLNLSKGSNAANSFITMIAQDGVLKKYSLAGKDLFQGKLNAKDINSKVAVDDSRGHIYYAASSQSKTYVYDANLAQKFTYASAGKTLMKFQYYRLGAETVYVFHYKDSTEILNSQGKVLLNNIKTKDNVVMLYQSASKSTDVYYIEDKSLKKASFSF
jgi:hypothetical protein